MNEKNTIWCSKKETFSAADKKRWSLLKDQVAQTKVEARELPDGYAFRLEGGDTVMTDLAEWVSYESRCCPFFNFDIILHRDHGPLWLKIWGGEGVKEFVRNLTILKNPGSSPHNPSPLIQSPLPVPICCNNNAFTTKQRTRYAELNDKVNGARTQIKHLADGYTYKLKEGVVSLPDLVEWVLLERVCCPFLDFGIHVEQDRGILSVTLSGIPNSTQTASSLP
jgi:hypothetical protein